ncbi:N-acetylmuramoyl-L-alanine amidase [Clostridium weizhouense]|uniref:N-acetylmuramoyl-L-alanine amidase n=1 Tax=Clostridium weizhouense TaxID=2859781 RepID=A0ABS7ATG9_9CLOT|nr:N-acetylmuramoyl-L-alanine amidase [Clostridium weizhouense]MBW6410775.1 N-acetylmuramoyl-L-alanine amidase [Clostridium weizhouense]
MKFNRKIVSLFLSVAITVSIVPVTKVQAAPLDINIISNTEVTAEQAKKWAASKGASSTFINLADLFWKYAKDHGNVNPGIAYVQSAKETGFGKFGGVLDETYYNTCGLKTSSGGDDYDPNAHYRFNSWDEGVQAQLDHLALYAGAEGYPRQNTYDPRHFLSIKGKATTVNSLGGKWAPSSTYGEEINQSYVNLLTYSGINNPSSVNNPIQNTDSNGNMISSIGWRYKSGKWYYYKSDGTLATGWIKTNNNWYYLHGNGSMATGWTSISGKWYYLKSSGVMQTGWIKDKNKWYYLQGDGSMVTGLNSINNKKYFLDSSGAMKIGWVKIGWHWYYFNTDGRMLNGWIKPNGKWYYLYAASGAMAIGWVNPDGQNWYYLNSDGSMATGWKTIGDDIYYLNPYSGVMSKNTIVDGWEIDAEGKRVKKVSLASKKLIVIDPGHNFGGNDGAYATHNRITYCERDLNMQLALKLKSKLEAQGYQIMLTRKETDRETLALVQSLTNRVNMANNFNADFFISIHHNASESSAANGVETYYSSNRQDSGFGYGPSDSKLLVSKKMANSINNSIVNKTGAYNRGAKDANFFVCRNTNMPSVLVEAGFITNPQEAIKCADNNYQNKTAEGIKEAVINGI